MKAKRSVRRGEPGYEILAVKALPDEKLPVEYTRGGGYYCRQVHRFADSIEIYDGTHVAKGKITVGTWIPSDSFEELIGLLRVCGERLHRIRQGLVNVAKEFEDGKIVNIRI